MLSRRLRIRNGCSTACERCGCIGRRTRKMWTLATATLALDSCRVVAFRPSGTTSRAADLESPRVIVVGVRVGPTGVAQTSGWILLGRVATGSGAWTNELDG